MFPLPLLANPVTFVVLSLTQAYVVPARLLLVLNTIGVIAVLEQTVCVLGVATPTGSGLTVIVAIKVLPAQPSVVGVIVNVTVCEVPVTLLRDPEISPLPLAAIPVTLLVLFLIQA